MTQRLKWIDSRQLADQLPKLEDIDLHGQRVLLRADLNVTFEPGTTNIADDSRIHATVPTIDLLRVKGAKIVLCSHLGRPKGRIVPEMRIDPVRRRTSEVLGIEIFGIGGPVGSDAKNAVDGMSDGEVAILENLRFHPGEEANDESFSHALASMGDVYVNDAFGASHRSHASIVGVASILPAYAGLLMRAEIEALNRALSSDERPAIAILGGAKVADKLAIVSSLARNVDAILIGGGMISAIFAAQGLASGSVAPAKAEIDAARSLLDDPATSEKLRLPEDVIVAETFSKDSVSQRTAVADISGLGYILDIGPNSITNYTDQIAKAKKVIWNGPMGLFEWPAFSQGTGAIAEAIAGNDRAFKLAGGGSTVEAINTFDVSIGLSHISTGGGASLEFLEGKVLPGVAALQKSYGRGSRMFAVSDDS